MSLDPLEQYESGYVYGGNNPISMNDPSGMWADDINKIKIFEKTVIDKTGKIIYWDSKSNDKHIYVSTDGKQGLDGNTTGLDVVGNEQQGFDYSVGRYIIPGSNIPMSNRYPATGRIEEDYTLEKIFIPGISIFKYLKALWFMKKLIDDLNQEGIAPSGWIKKSSKKGGGTVFQDPANPHNSIRKMPGNPNSPNAAQQNPYVIFKKNGVAYDVNGNPLPSTTDPAAHIPVDEFKINNMPKFY